MQTDAMPIIRGSLGSWQFSLSRTCFERTELERHYDSSSSNWQEKIQHMGFDSAYRTLLAQALQGRSPETGGDNLRVLDAGIGTGAMSAALCDTLEQPCDITGVDISSAMLQQASQQLTNKARTVTMQKGQLDDLQMPENSFDVVLAAHVLEHHPNPKRAVAALFRVLKPGGRIVASITRRSLFGAYVQALWRTHRVGPAEGVQWFRDVGFQNVRAIKYPTGTRARRFSCGYVGQKPAQLPFP